MWQQKKKINRPRIQKHLGDYGIKIDLIDQVL